MTQERELIVKTIEDIKETVDLFYQQKTKEALNRLNVVLGEMMEAVDALFAYHGEHSEFDLDEERISNSLKEAMEALQDMDLVLLADILQYDFVEYMEELVEKMD